MLPTSANGINLTTGTIRIRLLHTAGVGKSQVDERIADMEILTNPTVGLAAHSGQVDVRITAKAGSSSEAERLIAPIESEIRSRLGDWIYGVDGESLESAALQRLGELGWSLRLIVDSQASQLALSLSQISGPFLGAEILAVSPEPESLLAIVAADRQAHSAHVGLGVALYAKENRQDVLIILITPDGKEKIKRPYGGPPQYAPRWAINQSPQYITQFILCSSQKSQDERNKTVTIDCDLLLTNAIVLTMDEAYHQYEPGALAIQGDTILAVGPEDTLKNQYNPASKLDCGGKVLMPGLVNAHTHVPMTSVTRSGR